MYFSPNNTQNGTENGLSDVNFADPTLEEVPIDEWSVKGGSCSDNEVGKYVPDTANTLVGWSIGRLGPIYFLAANPDRWSQIHTIILFDPGDAKDFTQGACDTKDDKYDINALLADWLASSPNHQNKLIVYTGERSETDNFQGLWNDYFADVWSRNNNIGAQVSVCNYDGMSHPDVLRNFAGYTNAIESTQMTDCPPDPSTGQTWLPWHP